MKRTIAIFKRDFAAYFKTPMGYVVFAIFMAVSGLYFSSGVLSSYMNMVGELAFIQSFFFVIIPLMTMRAFSEDRKNGTEVLLYTSPASCTEIVLGKYLAALALFGVMTAGTLIHVIITSLYGGRVDISVLGAYIGFIFLGAAYVAIGVFASALTENQIIAAIISFVVIIVLTLLDFVSTMLGSVMATLIDRINVFGLTDMQIDAAGSAVTNAIQWLNPATRLSNYIDGIFELSPLIFFLSVIAAFLYMTNRVIEKRRWSQG